MSVQKAGPALLYALNREHLAAPLVESLANLRTELFERIRRQVAAWRHRPVAAGLFGSVARADGDLDSDVDVFLIRPGNVDADDAEWQRQVSELAATITRWTGNAASMVDVSAAEARAMFERGEPVAGELIRDAIPLAGESIADVLSGRVR